MQTSYRSIESAHKIQALEFIGLQDQSKGKEFHLLGRMAQIINKDGFVHYISDVFPADENYFEQLRTQCQWQTERVKVFGKWHVLSRQTAWYGTTNYRYASQDKLAQPWLPVLLQIRAKVQALTGDVYHGVLLNYYPNGCSGMGWHSDNEPDLVPGSAIAAVSFGATRRFDCRHREGETHRIYLESGSLLIMSGAFQTYWKHQVPIQKKIKEPRINLTFRVMVRGLNVYDQEQHSC